ncbi:4'-phosphopantetheinyl transferase superfamily protein [Streptomyces sp. NPDC047043]|uniref:4'-phosphopantetheinyl transferase family protein n=1 Tax=Streptomyces sp. NPDC047043 TaxID=3154497 RepID=UPI0033EC74B6
MSSVHHEPLPLPAVYGERAMPGTWQHGPVQTWLVDSRLSDPPAAGDHRVLDAYERGRARSFARETDRRHYVAAHTALRRLLGCYLGTDPAAVQFHREPCPCCGAPHGRPAVREAPLHFSLSHSDGVALLAFASHPVGVDVEKLPSADTVGLVAEWLHERERAELAALPVPERPAAFARCWTRKEACLKGTGAGLAQGLSHDYVGTGTHPAGIVGWTLLDVSAPPGYAAACSVRDGPDRQADDPAAGWSPTASVPTAVTGPAAPEEPSPRRASPRPAGR